MSYQITALTEESIGQYKYGKNSLIDDGWLAQDVSQFPNLMGLLHTPESLRQERWDGIFFVDQPGYEDREKIWDLYKSKYQIEDRHPEGVTGWTGAEIKSACRLAQLQGISLSEAVRLMISLSVSAGSKVEQIRKRASGRCLCANSGEIYRSISEATGRRISHAS